MITLQKKHLAAALKCAPKKDIRYHLVGVCLDVATNGDVHLVGTDGHVMFAGLVPAPNVQWTGDAQKGPFQIIIPRDAAALALKSKTDALMLTAMPDGRYMLGDVVFFPVDGTYPDWRRVATWPANATPAPGNYNPDLLATASDAVRTWHDCKYPVLHQFGLDRAIMTGADMTGFCVVMPMRIDADDLAVRPFTAAV